MNCSVMHHTKIYDISTKILMEGMVYFILTVCAAVTKCSARIVAFCSIRSRFFFFFFFLGGGGVSFDTLKINLRTFVAYSILLHLSVRNMKGPNSSME